MTWCAAIAGCWTSDAVVDNTLTPDQLARLRDTFTLPPIDLCSGLPQATCDEQVALGQILFFEPALSGPIIDEDPAALGNPGDAEKVSCASCHDPKNYFIDTRSQPNNLSFGIKWTPHNALGLTNLALKDALETTGQPVYGWIGGFSNSPDLFAKLALPKAMGGSDCTVGTTVRADYLTHYDAAFPGAKHDDATITANVGKAFDAYERRLTTFDSDFDRFIAGNDDALSPSAQRGFALFVGRGTCVECHSGPLLSDLQFHVTGVRQTGPHAPATEQGRYKTTKLPADMGTFLTPSLRNVAKTGPYMHAGSRTDLWDVIDFYRRGGDADGFLGDKDPRIAPLDLTDDEAHDLEDFLDALTGTVDPKYQQRPMPEPLAHDHAQADQRRCLETSISEPGN